MRWVLLPVVGVALGGCAATATVMTKRGVIEATVNGGDAESIVVTNEFGLKRRIPREEIVDIDHPGNVLATIFGVATTVFAIDDAIFATNGSCSGPVTGRGVGAAPCILFGSIAVLSAGVVALGLWQWLSSRNAVTNPLPASDGDITKIPFAFPPEDPPQPPPLPLPALPPAPPPGL